VLNVSALKIHMSDTARDALLAFPEFLTERRGDTFIKVKAYIIFEKYFLFAFL